MSKKQIECETYLHKYRQRRGRAHSSNLWQCHEVQTQEEHVLKRRIVLRLFRDCAIRIVIVVRVVVGSRGLALLQLIQPKREKKKEKKDTSYDNARNTTRT
jgi:hypothetical protein